MVDKFIKNGTHTLDYTRVYIPKGEKGYRPLRVPSPEFRLYLHLYSNFLTFFLSKDMRYQHGFIPGLGTLLAWKDIMISQAYKARYITEWDLKGFFDNIPPHKITEELLKRGVPKRVANFLESINKSAIQINTEPLLDERKVLDLVEANKLLIQGLPIPWENSFFDEIRPNLNSNPNYSAKLEEEMSNLSCESIQEYIQMKWALENSIKPAKAPEVYNGVAQGAPTSPILANLLMDKWLKSFDGKVAYADDSTMFSDKPIKYNYKDSDVIINWEKSRKSKIDGVLVHPIRFLGIEFEGKKY